MDIVELSRGELISWVNSLLKASYTKIQQLGTGVAYCQLFDLLHPNKIPHSKINTKAKNEYQFLQNMKSLQVAMQKAGVAKMLDIEKIVKCKYQDNLQMMQWFKSQFDIKGANHGRPEPVNTVLKKEDSKINPLGVSNRSNTEFRSQSSKKQQTTQAAIVDMASFQEVLGELNKANLPVDEESVKNTSQSLFKKVRDIEQIVQGWDRSKPAKNLIQHIRRLIGQQQEMTQRQQMLIQ